MIALGTRADPVVEDLVLALALIAQRSGDPDPVEPVSGDQVVRDRVPEQRAQIEVVVGDQDSFARIASDDVLAGTADRVLSRTGDRDSGPQVSGVVPLLPVV